MPIYKIPIMSFINSFIPFPTSKFIEELIIGADNKRFEVIEDVYKRDIIIRCNKKPKDSCFYNIKWEEVEIDA